MMHIVLENTVACFTAIIEPFNARLPVVDPHAVFSVFYECLFAGLHLCRFERRRSDVLGRQLLGAAGQQRHCHAQRRLLTERRIAVRVGKPVKMPMGSLFFHCKLFILPAQQNNLCAWESCAGSSVVSQCLFTPDNVTGLSKDVVALSAGHVFARARSHVLRCREHQTAKHHQADCVDQPLFLFLLRF